MIVYRATNKINGEMYVGQTIETLKRRKRGHKDDAASGRTGCRKFHNAINKYGFENFVFEEIATAQDMDTLNNLEIYYIQWFNTKSPNGYNLTDGGRNARHSDESRKKMSESRKGKKQSQESIEKRRRSMIGKKHTEESRNKMAIKATGRMHTEVTKKKIGETGKGRPGFWKGKKLSAAHIKKLSESHKGHVMPESQKLALRIANIGKIASQESRKKMSEASIGIKKSKAHVESLIKARCKEFEVFDKKTGKFIGKWLVIKQCSQDLGLSRTAINNCLDGRSSSCGGYIFKRINK